MKKYFTLSAAFLLGLVLSSFSSMALPTVVLNNTSSYDVAIDGRYYQANNTYTISDLGAGTHNVGVYRIESNGVFGINKKRTLISSSQFNLYNNNNSTVTLDVDYNGHVRINQNNYNPKNGGYGNGQNNGSWNNGQNGQNNGNWNRGQNQNNGQCNGRHDDDNNRYERRNQNDKRYGKSEGKGKGNKYGHYKNGKYNNSNDNYNRSQSQYTRSGSKRY